MIGSSLKEVRAAKTAAARIFAELVGTVAVGVMRLADDSYGLKINLPKKPGKGIVLPNQVAGVPVKVEVVGQTRKR